MSKKLKALVVKEFEKDFSGLDRCIFVAMTGLPAIAADKVRAELASKHVRLRIVKNTLAAVALREVGLKGIEAYLEGPTAIVMGGSDIVDLAKSAGVLKKAGGTITVKGGYGEGKVLTPSDIEALSKVPGRKELLSMLAGAMSGMLGNFAGMLGAVQRNFVYALTAAKDKQGAATA
jgi:large subunit ribosomal protein L10